MSSQRDNQNPKVHSGSIKIHKALKVKNRLIGQLNNVREIIKRENSRRDDSVSTVNVPELITEENSIIEKLVAIKSALVKASVPISVELSELASYKDRINFIKSLPTREGEELIAYGRESEPRKYVWKATINRELSDNLCDELQKKINDIQDRIDEFNASTDVDYKE